MLELFGEKLAIRSIISIQKTVKICNARILIFQS